MAELMVENLSVDAGSRTLVSNASYTLKQGELVALLGPNGAGKTSLLRATLGLAPSSSVTRALNGRSVGAMSPRERARHLSYLPQTRPLAWPLSVRNVVALGRFAHGVGAGKLKGDDAEAVEQALARCSLLQLADRATDTLSGGELARVHFARAIAADAPLLIADEPVASLDPRHQHTIMGLVRLFVNGGGGALVVLHDIQLAARYADRLIWMKDGRIVADGSPALTLTTERLADIYGIEARVRHGPSGPDIRIDGPI